MRPSPIILDYLRPRDWRQLVRAATLLDISAGDYFEARWGLPAETLGIIFLALSQGSCHQPP